LKIIDANVLLYAVNRQSIEHEAAHRWLTGALSGNEVVTFDRDFERFGIRVQLPT